jgi:hypothetical protein
VEAFVSHGAVYVDIALLDLLWLFSFEQGVADIKRDSLHMLEFTVGYADALHSRKPFEQLDPYNSAALSEPQFRQLWEDALCVQRVAFENTLAFILAHEVGHLVLNHEEEAKQAFPDPATHLLQNADWLLWRRRVELAADRFGALLCLDALFQPAQAVWWLDLVEVRRSYYGESAEYPTPGQRASTIWAAYAERFGGDYISRAGRSNVDPLPPDRDMSKVDRARNLDSLREMRTFLRNFLAELDAQVGQILSQSQDAEFAAAFFIDQVKAYRCLLYGADHPDAIDEALARLGAASGNNKEFTDALRGLFARAFSAPEPLTLLDASLEDPLDIDGLRELLGLAREGKPIFANAIQLGHLLANTHFRWDPEVFQAMLARLPEPERTQMRLAPYRIGVPARRPRPTFEERIEVLRRWNGSYAEPYQELPLPKTIETK